MGTLNTAALITEAEFNLYYGVGDDAKNSHEPVIELINAVSASIAEYCNRVFVATEHTDIIDGTGRNNIYLKNWPLLDSDDSVSDPVVSFDVDRNNTWEVSSDLNLTVLWLKTGGELYLQNGTLFPCGTKNTRVVYTAGYANVASIPGDLKFACKKLVALYKSEADGERWGTSTSTIVTETVAFDYSKWPKDVLGIVNRYRRIYL